MNMFSTRKSDPTPVATPTPIPTPARSNGAHSSAASGGLLSRGVSIKGTVKSRDELLIDGEVEGTIEATGTLTIGEHASIKGEIKTKSIKVRGTVQGDIFATERCELQAGCTLQGDIEAPRLIVDENATFCGSTRVAPQE
jgi:cytoskeletal protein CcmA (bactofilin family)